MEKLKKDWKFLSLAGFFAVLLLAAYSNHFKNGFYFDDHHTIVNNTWIRELKNIPQFFVNHETVSIYPRNQGAMRPVVTTQNAIDYWLGGKKLNPKAYHIHMFTHYLILCVLLFFVYRNIFDRAWKGPWNRYIALLCTAWFALHTSNAETVNYIIARSDLYSTLMVVLTLLLFMLPKTRSRFLFLIPYLVALFTKEVTYMFPFVLLAFIWLFEEDKSIPDLFRARNLGHVGSTLRKAAPVFVLLVGALLYLFFVYHANTSNLTKAAGHTLESRINYFFTQSYVMLRYMGNFWAPVHLSADPDITIITDRGDLRIVFGMLQLIVLAGVAVIASVHRKTRPISFGLLWAYIFLAPTSSFNVMYQISNDHRTLVAFIGLIMAFGWLAALVAYLMKERLADTRLLAGSAIGLACLALTFHAYGVHERNKVWSSAESLWYDVTQKSPKNPRGLMNYGLTLMGKGQYEEAKSYYLRALDIWPGWVYLHINMGILLDAQGKPAEAEPYFKNALKFGSDNPDSFYFYGRYLFTHKRYDEARDMLQRGKRVSPYHSKINELLPVVERISGSGGSTVDVKKEAVEKTPTAAGYLELSLAYYQARQYEASIEAARQALALQPENAAAWNNICAGYCGLKQWEKAIDACNRSLAINPDFQRAKNNLKWATDELKKQSGK